MSDSSWKPAVQMIREACATQGYAIKETARGFITNCPAHDDSTPSLSVDQGEKGALLKCRSQDCTPGSIMAALRMEPAQLFDARRGDHQKPRAAREEKSGDGFATLELACQWWKAKQGGGEVTQYSYLDASARPVFAVLRCDLLDGGKTFLQVKLERGRWHVGAPTEMRPLYGLPYLPTDSEEVVLVVEGEKKVELLRSLGFAATTSAQGAKSAAQTDWLPMRSRRVVILPDNDSAGAQYAENVRQLIGKAGASQIAVVQLQGLAKGEDVVQFVERNKPTAKERLEAIVRGLTKHREEEDSHGSNWRALSFDELLAEPPVEWLVDGLLPRVGVSLLASEPRAGKSFLALDLALHLACDSSKFLGQSLRGNGAVAFVALEGLGGMAGRARAWSMSHSRALPKHPLHLIRWSGAAPLTEGAQDFGDELRRCKRKSESLALIIVDTLTLGLGCDENDSGQVGPALRFLAALSDELQCCVLLLHHVRKDGKLGRPSRMTLADVRGSSALVGNVDCVLGLEHREGREERALLSLKMKDGEQGAPLWFRLVSKATGKQREDGTNETSCVVESTEPPVEVEVDREEERAKRHGVRLAKRRQEVADNVLALVQKSSGLNRTALKRATGVAAELAQQVIAELLAEGRLVERTGKGKGKGIYLPEMSDELVSVLERSGTYQNGNQNRRNGSVPFRSVLGVLGGERDGTEQNTNSGGGA